MGWRPFNVPLLAQSGHERLGIAARQTHARTPIPQAKNPCCNRVKKTMRRRDFIITTAGSSVAWPLVARSHRPTMPVIGFLGSTTSTERPERLRAFRRGLGETGFTEGQNVAIEFRWAEGHYDRFLSLRAILYAIGWR